MALSGHCPLPEGMQIGTLLFIWTSGAAMRRWTLARGPLVEKPNGVFFLLGLATFGIASAHRSTTNFAEMIHALPKSGRRGHSKRRDTRNWLLLTFNIHACRLRFSVNREEHFV